MHRARKIGLLSAFIWLMTSAQLNGQDLVINEVMFYNDTAVTDQFGEFHPWVELYNRGDAPISLNDYYLSNQQENPLKWHLPSVILAPDSVVLIFFSALDFTDEQPYHTSFYLAGQSSKILLFSENGALTDQTPEQCVPENYSYCRLPNGFESWEFPSHATPGVTNNTAYALNDVLPQTEIEPSLPSGFYDQHVQLSLSTTEEADIRYTLDSGSEPGLGDLLYSNPVVFSGRKDEPNHFSNIVTTSEESEFEQPEGPVNKAHVIRAAAFWKGCLVSPVYTGNYLVTSDSGDPEYPVDVVFVNAAPENLFDAEKGIYVAGNDENFRQRGDDWERPAHVEFIGIGGDVLLGQDAGIRIHGGGTRAGPQKSLRLYARSDYGESWFAYPFFEDRDLNQYKRLILRMSMGDWSRTLFKDQLCHYLVRDLNVNYQSGKPVVVFLNGEYWGIHGLRERLDTRYLESHFDVDGDNVDMIEYNLSLGGIIVEEGDGDAYNELIQFIESHNIEDPAHYETLSGMMDIPGFIDHHIVQLYFANTDFPDNNNGLWRENEESGTWRWLFYDCDACMVRPQYNHIFENVHESDFFTEKADWSMIIFRALLKNRAFKDAFVGRFRTLLNTTFSAGTVIAAIESFEATYTPLVSEHIERWHYPNNFNEWVSNVQGIRAFAMDRPIVLHNLLDRYFGNPFIVVPNPNDGQFAIQFTGEERVGLVRLFSNSGQEVFSNDYGDAALNTIQINEKIPVGMYLLRVEIAGKHYSQKVVVAEKSGG